MAAPDVPLPAPQAPLLARWIEGSTWVPPCAVLWAREVYEAVGGWDEQVTYNDDGDLMMRALLHGVPLVQATQGEALYRHHGTTRGSMSTAVFSEAKLRSQARVLEKLASAIRDRGAAGDCGASLGRAFTRLALLCFQAGRAELGRAALARARAFGPRAAVSRTRFGRALERVLGLERKESLILQLARRGMMTPARKAHIKLQRRLQNGPQPSEGV